MLEMIPVDPWDRALEPIEIAKFINTLVVEIERLQVAVGNLERRVIELEWKI